MPPPMPLPDPETVVYDPVAATPEPEDYESGSEASEAPSLMDFDQEGNWDSKTKSGPAIHTPEDVKAIPVNEFRVEWLNMSKPEENLYAKNHMMAILKFDGDKRIDGVIYKSARVSMELGVEKTVESIGRENWRPGQNYFPGEYTVRLLQYETTTRRSVHENTFPLRQGTTIGTIINMIIQNNMHHFCFLPYTAPGRWKGCGDHLLHCWALLVRNGIIPDENSAEEPDMPLSAALTNTYLEEDRKTREPIGRGWWVSHNPIEDGLAPEFVFSEGRLTYQFPALTVSEIDFQSGEVGEETK